MIALVLATLLLVQEPATTAPLSEEARVLIAPVQEAIDAEEARQAALPPPANDRERLSACTTWTKWADGRSPPST